MTDVEEVEKQYVRVLEDLDKVSRIMQMIAERLTVLEQEMEILQDKVFRGNAEVH